MSVGAPGFATRRQQNLASHTNASCYGSATSWQIALRMRTFSWHQQLQDVVC
jgi:hypothetical protein